MKKNNKKTMSRKIKIANISCVYPPQAGGIANSAKRTENLLASKFAVESFYPDNLKPWIRRGYGAFSPSLFLKLRKFDYIYLHYPFFGTAEIVWFFKIFHKKPKLIIHYHMDVKNLKLMEKILSIPSRLILNSLLRQSETIVSASLDYIKNSGIKKYYKKNPEKFKEIAFALDLEKFKPKDLKQKDPNNLISKTKELINFVNEKFIKRNKVEFIFVAGLDSAHYFKGLSNLLKALSLIRLDWRLNIVGDGNLRESYEKESYILGLEKKVIFHGKLSDPDLLRAYQEADCLVLPSINSNEAFGLVLIEAMACGLPVIASNLPGVRTVFQDEKQGFLVEPNNVNDLREKLEKIALDKNLRKKMSLAARNYTYEKYDIKKMQKSLESLFYLKK